MMEPSNLGQLSAVAGFSRRHGGGTETSHEKSRNFAIAGAEVML